MEERSTGMSWIAVLFVIIVVVALFGGNFGGGLEYDIDSKLTIGFEGKYQLVDDFDQGVISIGLTYRF